MRKIAPVVFSEEENVEIQEQLGVQEATKAAPKSRDAINYPVFEVPVNKKVLIYVPNHIVQDAEGVDQLRADKPLIHSLKMGKRYVYYRCIANINMPSHGFNGECPLCEGCSEPWDLANEIIKEKCKAQHLDPEDVDNKDVKSIRSEAFSDRVLKDATRYYTFPIVVFDTLNDDGKTFIKDENGGYKYKVMWYTISESQYEKTWEKALDGMEEVPTHPGGNFFLLNYMYTPKRGEPNKRDSARNLSVVPRTIKNSEKMRELLDKQTEGWTPAKAQEMVINNAIYSPEDLEGVVDDCLTNTRNLLALYSAKKVEADNNGIESSQEDGFKLTEKPKEASTPIEMDETDLDTEGLEVK